MNTEAEEEDVFQDANTSPDNTGRTPGLRRSTRKRKSISEEDLEDHRTPKTGKRHRPLGTMGGVQRSPDNTGKKATKNPKQPTAGASMTVTTDPPTNTPTTEQMVLLGGMRAVLQEELSKTEARLTGRMADVEAGLGLLKEDFRGLEQRVDQVEQRMKNESLRRIEDPDLLNNWNEHISAQSDSGPSNAKHNRYMKARRSLRIWPIKGNAEDLRLELQKFLTHKLRLGEDVLSDTGDCSIRKIPAGHRNQGNINNEVTVEFPSIELRDVVRAAAYNLAGHPGAGIRLEVPHHLMANFKALNSAAYKLKTRYSGCKRNIKYDDELCDLVLDFKTDEDSGWKRIRPSQAKEFLKDNGGAANELSVADLTELLGECEGEQEEGTADEGDE